MSPQGSGLSYFPYHQLDGQKEEAAAVIHKNPRNILHVEALTVIDKYDVTSLSFIIVH